MRPYFCYFHSWIFSGCRFLPKVGRRLLKASWGSVNIYSASILDCCWMVSYFFFFLRAVFQMLWKVVSWDLKRTHKTTGSYMEEAWLCATHRTWIHNKPIRSRVYCHDILQYRVTDLIWLPYHVHLAEFGYGKYEVRIGSPWVFTCMLDLAKIRTMARSDAPNMPLKRTKW